MKRAMMLLTLLCLPLLGMAENDGISEQDYVKLVPPLPVTAGKDKVEVVEFFWYGCPHCNDLEPYLHTWLEEKPEYIEFVRIPAIFKNPRWKLHARAFYTAEVLGVMERFHSPFFDAIHRNNQRMADREAIKAFFAGIGVDGKTFDNAFDSFEVASKVNRAVNLTRRSGISGVPSLIVNGKYRTVAHTYNDMLRVTETLADREKVLQATAGKAAGEE